MLWPDLITASFEVAGGFLNLIDISTVWKHKRVQGVHWFPRAVFTAWGYWNLYYYPHLDQWLAFWGGVGLVMTNAVWTSLAIYYWRRQPKYSVAVPSDDGVTILSPADYEAFVRALDAPAEPSESLKELMRRCPSWEAERGS